MHKIAFSIIFPVYFIFRFYEEKETKNQYGEHQEEIDIKSKHTS